MGYHQVLSQVFQCATRPSSACRCEFNWNIVDPAHAIPSLGLMFYV
jgi:hypothetical protein